MPIPRVRTGLFRRFVFPLLQKRESNRFFRTRKAVASRHLVGEGIEIGALHEPLPVSARARVRYLDRLTVTELREQYPELAKHDLVDVDIVDDGEVLQSLDSQSQDFVIANHVLEHCEDPIGAVKHWLRVLKPGGRLYLAVPDKRHTFDAPREVTSIDHLVRDHEEGPITSRRDHYVDWTRYVEGKPEEEIDDNARKLEARRYSIHFHVWTSEDFAAFLNYLKSSRELPFSVSEIRRNGMETIAVLTRAASPAN